MYPGSVSRGQRSILPFVAFSGVESRWLALLSNTTRLQVKADATRV